MKPTRTIDAGTRRRIRRLLPIFFLGVAGVWIAALAGCGGNRQKADSQVEMAPMEPGSAPSAMMPAPPAVESADAVVAGAPANVVLATVETGSPRREIIYIGAMTVEVDDVESAASRLIQAVQASGGWVSSRQLQTDSDGHRTATVEVRVPSARFDGIHDAAKGIGTVVRDATQSRDVGKEFVDLEARLRNLEREESVIAGLFDRRGKISEVLEVERELARVRGEIERIQGQLRYLRDQVSYSTLNVTLMPRRPAIERKMESWNLGYHMLRAWRALVGIVRSATYFAIYALVVVLPLGLVAWAIWRGARYLSRRRSRSD